MFIDITSKTNKIYKHIKNLGSKKYREKYNEFIIEGIRLVREAIDSSAQLSLLAVSESFSQSDEGKQYLQSIEKYRIKVYRVNDKMFQEITQTQTPQGILGIASMGYFSLQKLLKERKENPFYIYCDGIQDPGNMGTIIRTADAVNADGVLLSRGCVDIYNPKTVRSTMGSLFHLPIVKVGDSDETLDYLKENGLVVLGGHLKASKYCYEIDMKQGIVIVIGNEANGISKEVVTKLDYLVKIPMPGRAESLNAAVAAGILMYEVVRQRVG